MNNEKKCETCKEPLKSSQYASIKLEGQPAKKAGQDLVCGNYPACEKSEIDPNVEAMD